MSKTMDEKKKLVIQKLDDFDLPYTDGEVEALINDYWLDGCDDDANVNEIILQHQYNIS